MDVKLDENTFFSRLKRLFQHHKQNPALYNNADCFEITAGQAVEEGEAIDNKKSTVLAIWLLGYEFTDTVMFFKDEVVHFLTSTKKANVLAPLKNKNPEMIMIHDRNNVSSVEFLKIVNPSKKIGVLMQDKKELKVSVGHIYISLPFEGSFCPRVVRRT